MRKEKIVELHDGDNILTFKIKQMSASAQEEWIVRIILLVLGTEAGTKALGSADMQNLQSKVTDVNELIKLLGQLKFDDVKPLYNQLLDCCYYVPDAGNMNFVTKLNINNADSIISSFQTLFKLRVEALKVNFGFFKSGVKSPKAAGKTIKITKNM